MYKIDVGLNVINSNRIFKSKVATYELFKHENIPSVEHIRILNPKHSHESLYVDVEDDVRTKAPKFLNKHGKIVVKPESGGAGQSVYLVDSIEELTVAMEEIFKSGANVTLSPYLNSEYEYRVVMLNDEVRFVFRKEKTTSWKHNLSSGGAKSVRIYEDNPIFEKLSKIAVKATKVSQAKFVAIDFFEVNGEFLLLEVNTLFGLYYSIKDDEKTAEEVGKMYVDAFNSKFDSI